MDFLSCTSFHCTGWTMAVSYMPGLWWHMYSAPLLRSLFIFREIVVMIPVHGLPLTQYSSYSSENTSCESPSMHLTIIWTPSFHSCRLFSNGSTCTCLHRLHPQVVRPRRNARYLLGFTPTHIYPPL